MKKVMFSIILASAFSVVSAQETVKTTKGDYVELNPEYRFSKAENKSVKIIDEPVSKKETNNNNGQQSVTPSKSATGSTKLAPAKDAAKPTPIKVSAKTKK